VLTRLQVKYKIKRKKVKNCKFALGSRQGESCIPTNRTPNTKNNYKVTLTCSGGGRSKRRRPRCWRCHCWHSHCKNNNSDNNHFYEVEYCSTKRITA